MKMYLLSDIHIGMPTDQSCVVCVQDGPQP